MIHLPESGDINELRRVFRLIQEQSNRSAQAVNVPQTVKIQTVPSASSGSATTITQHNSLSGLQGGTTGEYYHLSLKDYTTVTTEHGLTKDFTGFSDPDNVVVTYDSTARTVTLTGTVAGYYQGVQVAALTSGWTSPAHPAGVTAPQFLYYNGTSFVWSSTSWTFDMLMIALVIYDAAGNFRCCVREPHGFMDWESHREFHQTIGTYLISGGDISGVTLGSTTTADRRPDISATQIADEDLITTNPALTSKLYTWHYLSGAGTSNWSTGNAEIVNLSGANPYYNQLTGGVWQQTLVANNDYASVFVIAVPTAADTASQAYRYVFIQGQSTGTLASQQAFQFTSLNLGQITSLFPEYTPIARIIMRYQAADWTIVQVDKIATTRIQSSTSSSGLSAVTADTTLTGLGTLSSPLGINLASANTWTAPITISTGATEANFILSSNAATTRTVTLRTAGVNRWVVGASASAESGSNAGSDFTITSYDDAGSVIDIPISIGRVATSALSTTRLFSSTSAGIHIFGPTTGTTSTSIAIRSANQTNKCIRFQTGTTDRWTIYSDNSNETGSEAGSNFRITAYNDAGTIIDSPMLITRAANGAITFAATRTINCGNISSIGSTFAFGSSIANAATILGIRSAAGWSRGISFLTGTSVRWYVYADAGAESGSDAGTAFRVAAYNDSGTLIDTPIIITRAASGAMTLSRPTSITNNTASTTTTTGALKVTGGVATQDYFTGKYRSSDGTAGLTATRTFYTASTSGGTVNVLNTVTIKDGIITSWVQA